MAGGIAGSNYGGSIIACYHETGTVQNDFSAIGGVVGYNWNEGKIIACYSTSAVSAVQGYNSGGVVGQNGSHISTAYAYVYACYWSGDVTSDRGIGTGIGDVTKVDDTTVTWQKAVDAMNTAIEQHDSSCPYRWADNGTNPPSLTTNP